MKISKFEHIVNVAYALVVTFAVVGCVAKSTALLPVVILLVTIVLWTAGRIVRDGAMSLIALVYKGDKE